MSARIIRDDEADRKKNWRDDAMCAQIGPELWFPENGRRALAAKEICKTVCKVREECLEFAVTTPSIQDGIWGGLSPKEIRDIRKQRGIEGESLPEEWEEDPELVYDEEDV